ncbi:MAG: hypothetical protein KIC80_06560 [Brachyspira sp.]|jgi:hypothetical protein|nr:hypothetical protein [Brachyspira sp.]
MEKNSAFSKVILFLCFIALIVNAVETNQIRLQTKSASAETLIQKIMYNFPVDVKLAQKVINNNHLGNCFSLGFDRGTLVKSGSLKFYIF